jgi:hypothetical protein
LPPFSVRGSLHFLCSVRSQPKEPAAQKLGPLLQEQLAKPQLTWTWCRASKAAGRMVSHIHIAPALCHQHQQRCQQEGGGGEKAPDREQLLDVHDALRATPTLPRLVGQRTTMKSQVHTGIQRHRSAPGAH